MATYKEYIESLTKEINKYVENGGNIYTPKRQLPYYEKVSYAADLFEKETGIHLEDYSMIYKDCGFNYSKSFYKFSEMKNQLSLITDENGYVDEDKAKDNKRTHDNIRSYLNTHSLELGITPGEYLILMTDYRYKNLMVTGDYIKHLQSLFDKRYPSGKVKSLKREDPELFWKVDHFRNYFPGRISYDDALAFFGITNINDYKKPDYQPLPLNENILLEKLQQAFPDGKIGKDFTSMRQEYYNAIRLAAKSGLTISEYLKENGFDYTAGITISRFSRFKLNDEDAKAHETKLLTLKNHFLREYNLEGLDEVSLFEINLEVAKKVSQAIYGEQKAEVSEFDKILSGLFKAKENSNEENITKGIDPNTQVIKQITEQVKEDLNNQSQIEEDDDYNPSVMVVRYFGKSPKPEEIICETTSEITIPPFCQ